jgi:SAM-dependent methyltransferase
MSILEAPQHLSDYNRLWTDTYGDIQRVGPAHFHARRIVKRLLRPLHYWSVLDVGSGPGWNLDLLSAGRRLDTFVGVDISEEAIRQAQNLGLGGKFLVHDIQAKPVSGHWDLVYAGLMIHLVPDDMAALCNMRQNTGKYLLISTMAGDFQRHKKLEQRLGAIRNYRPGELEEKLTQAGFRVRQAIYWGFPFFSPLGRWFQNASSTGTGSYSWGTQLVAQALIGLYYLNSHRRGDLLTVLAEI